MYSMELACVLIILISVIFYMLVSLVIIFPTKLTRLHLKVEDLLPL